MAFEIPLTKPYLSDGVKRRVMDVLESGHWTEGSVTGELESAFASYTGARHALAVTSCTAGLELGLRAIGVGPGDEVIVPDFTYPATASVVRIVGARPVLVDVSPETMLIDYDALEAALTSRTRAIIPVSLFGNPLDWDRLDAIRTRCQIPIIEDAACSIGAAYRGHRVGSLADITVFSLHPRKFITSGEGGIVTTGDRGWHEWMWSYKHFGMRGGNGPDAGDFLRVGTNYKLSNVLAAIAVAQMECIDTLTKRRADLSNRYLELLAPVAAVKPQAVTPRGTHSRQSFCIRVPDRGGVLSTLRDSGIEVQIGSYSLHQQPAFAAGEHCAHAGRLEGSRACSSESLVLPLFDDLSEAQQRHVVKRLADLLA